MMKLKIPIVWPKIVEPAHNAEPTLPVPKIKQNNKGRGQHKEDITNIIKSMAYIISCIQLISLGSQSNFVHLWTSHTFLKQLNEKKKWPFHLSPSPHVTHQESHASKLTSSLYQTAVGSGVALLQAILSSRVSEDSILTSLDFRLQISSSQLPQNLLFVSLNCADSVYGWKRKITSNVIDIYI